MRKKITVSWGFVDSLPVDFGLFPAHKKNQILVDEVFWNKYLDARFEFEAMHRQLEKKIK